MPGIVVFGRRWTVGSDDFIVPAIGQVILHTIWIAVLTGILGVADFNTGKGCSATLRLLVICIMVLLCCCLILEAVIAVVSLRGNILFTKPRISMQYLLYIRLVLVFAEMGWIIWAIVWMADYYDSCPPVSAKRGVLGIIVCLLVIVLLYLVTLWCTFDTAGRKWVKMKRFQDSLKEKKRPIRRSGGGRRNWRQSYLYNGFLGHIFASTLRSRKAFRAYEESWDRRFHLLCCCVQRQGTNKNSITEVAQLFTDFFRDLDVVPSDVIVGLVLLRRHQKLRMKYTEALGSNDVCRFLSGVAITPATRFLSFRQADTLDMFKRVIHYMRFALGAYGWPVYIMMHTTLGLCRIASRLNCCCCLPCFTKSSDEGRIIGDNCCECNHAALGKLVSIQDRDIIYVTYHVNVGETPFYVALDHLHKKVVIAIRGTLSLQDILTDLKADSETLPIVPPRDDWYGHKGITQAAVYIKKKLEEEMILTQAFSRDLERGTDKYDLVLVGHSLGAGTASILTLLLKQDYPNLHCYAYSPPGGLLSPTCVMETKSFITSVVVGKDVVPRIGLYQMELLRTDLINVIKKSIDPKWKTIGSKLICCRHYDVPPNMDVYDLKAELEKVERETDRDVTAHPFDSAIGLSAHKPLYLPGQIIHIVRSHPKQKGRCKPRESVYQAVWADNCEFDEVLVSPTMIQDHMPDNVLKALIKTLANVGPSKPSRVLSEAERKALLAQATPIGSECGSPQRLFLETTFSDPGGQSSKEQVITTAFPIDTPEQVQLQVVEHVENSLRTWDVAADQLLRTDDVDAADPLKPKSFYLTLENDWHVAAPLASPESLYAISRSSSLTGNLKDNWMRPSTSSNRMMTILQSPPLGAVLRSENINMNNSIKDVNIAEESIPLNSCTSTGAHNSRHSLACVENDAVTLHHPPTAEAAHLDMSNENECLINSVLPKIDENKCSDFLSACEKSNNCLSCTPTLQHSRSVGDYVSGSLVSTERDQLRDGYRAGYYSVVMPNHEANNVKSSQNNTRLKSDSSIGKCNGHDSKRNNHIQPPLHHVESDSYIKKLESQTHMHRSTAEQDIAHMADKAHVHSLAPPLIQRGRLQPKTSSSGQSTKLSTVSLSSNDSTKQVFISSPQSDDVFEFPIAVEETDV